MKVARWGNSLAVRLPKDLVDVLNLKDGDDVQLRPMDDGGIEVARDARRDEALARMRALRRPLPPGFKFDRDEIYDNARNGFRRDRGDE